MSRSGYTDDYDCDDWSLNLWRGAVVRGIRGKRGQAFLKEMAAAMDAMPEKRLIANDLEEAGEVCAIGSVGKARGVDMSELDPEDRYAVADVFNISPAMAAEVVFMNDEASAVWDRAETPEERFARMRAWIEANLRPRDTDTKDGAR